MQLMNNVNNDKNLSCKPNVILKGFSCCLTLSTHFFYTGFGCKFVAITLLLMFTKIYTNLTDETNFLQDPSSNKVKSLRQFNRRPLKNMVTFVTQVFFLQNVLSISIFICIYIYFSKQRLYCFTS